MEEEKNVKKVYKKEKIIREEVMKKEKKIEEIMKKVLEKIEIKKLKDMKGRVKIGGEKEKEVEEDFMKKKGFLK